ncbi:MAG: PAS domain S-box protein [Cytophagales bacterium]|nr:PAS domain S-box protein [Bernardetiaceae bacterium]MDW8204074.1 PAS domain S-box protein [Cytophagales bacterium]
MNEDWSNFIPEYLRRSQTYLVVLTDLEGRYVFVNELFQKRFHFITENFVGQPAFIAIYPEDHAKCLQAVEQCLANPDKVVKIDLRKPDTSHNDFYWTSWEFSVVKSHTQEPVGIVCIGHDITATERASREAKVFADKVETIIEEITDGFYQIDNQWRFVRVNKVAEQILGLSRQALLGKTLWELFPNTTDYNYSLQLRKAMQEGVTISFEDYRPDLDKWFSTVVYPSVEGLTVFFKDVTQEKKNIWQLHQQEYMLRAIYNSTTEASTFIDTDLIIRYNNRVAQEITQKIFGKAAQPGEPSLDYVLPEYQALFEGYYRRVLQGESMVLEYTDGTQWWQFSLLPVYDEQQRIIGIAHNVQNISERKEKEQKLAESRQQLQKIIEAIPHPLLIVNQTANVEYVNEEFEKVFGYMSEEIVGKNINLLIPERYRASHQHLHQNYMAQGGKSVRMGRFLAALTKSGKEIATDASLNTFWSNNEQFVIVILQDVSEQKLYQDTIVRQNKILQDIAWQQSHHLRRPVASILGLCDLLSNYSNTESEKRQYVHYLNLAARELDDIIHRIVDATNSLEKYEIEGLRKI